MLWQSSLFIRWLSKRTYTMRDRNERLHKAYDEKYLTLHYITLAPNSFFPKFTIIQTPGSWYINRGDKKVEILYLKFQILKLLDSSYVTLFYSRMLRMTSLECRLIFLLSFSHFSVINSLSLGTIKSCLWVRRNGGGTWSVIQFFLIELPIYKKLYLQYTGKNIKLLQFLF